MGVKRSDLKAKISYFVSWPFTRDSLHDYHSVFGTVLLSFPIKESTSTSQAKTRLTKYSKEWKESIDLILGKPNTSWKKSKWISLQSISKFSRCSLYRYWLDFHVTKRNKNGYHKSVPLVYHLIHGFLCWSFRPFSLSFVVAMNEAEDKMTKFQRNSRKERTRSGGCYCWLYKKTCLSLSLFSIYSCCSPPNFSLLFSHFLPSLRRAR